MKTIWMTLALGGLLTAADPPQTFTGVITDTMCGAKHTMMPGKPDADCVKACVKGSAQYALYDGQDVWKLSDQKKPANFAAKKVKVTGTLDAAAKTIKVVSIEAQ